MSVSKGVATWRKADRRRKNGKQGGKKTGSAAAGAGSGDQPTIVEAGEGGVTTATPKETKKERLCTAKREEKPVIIEKPSNYFKLVSESKEVTKMYSMLSGCMQVQNSHGYAPSNI